MDALGWVVLVGVVAYPFLFAYAYAEYRAGERTRESMLKSTGVGGPGFAVLLQQAADRWLSSPVDDVVALASFVFLAVGVWALYRAYVANSGTSDAGSTPEN